MASYSSHRRIIPVAPERLGDHRRAERAGMIRVPRAKGSSDSRSLRGRHFFKLI